MKQETEILIEALMSSGFVIPAKVYDYVPDNFEDNTPEFVIKNELGVYVGDVLEAKGWAKNIDEQRGKKWVVFTSPEKNIEISHRDMNEYDATVFSIKEL